MQFYARSRNRTTNSLLVTSVSIIVLSWFCLIPQHNNDWTSTNNVFVNAFDIVQQQLIGRRTTRIIPSQPTTTSTATSTTRSTFQGNHRSRNNINSIKKHKSILFGTTIPNDSDQQQYVNGETPTTTTTVATKLFSVESDVNHAYGPIHTLTIHELPGEKVLHVEPTTATTTTTTSTEEKEEEEEKEDSEETSNSSSSSSSTTSPPPIVIETGKIGRQAAGSVTLVRGDTVLYATAARDSNPKQDIDFLPLSVEHQERFSSAGTTSGSYNKRDGRPAEHEILTCRLIDRPLRPLIASGYQHETQLLSWVLSYDGIRSCDPLAITASAAALYLSDVPLSKPVAAVMVGFIPQQPTTTTTTTTTTTIAEEEQKQTDDASPQQEQQEQQYQFVLNPTNSQMEKSRLHLTIAGTKDAVLMIEGAADFLPEETMIEAVRFGHKAVQVLCEGLQQLGQAVGITKNYDTIRPPIKGLQQQIDTLMTERIDAMYTMKGTKEEKGKQMAQLQQEAVEEILQLQEQSEKDNEGEDDDDNSKEPVDTKMIYACFKDLLRRRMYHFASTQQLRYDGRTLNEVRDLHMEAGFLPRVHGSALFTRGETQTIATATLGDAGMRQKIDKIDGMQEKRFYLQYSFPPSCVGETGRVGAPGRREVGHGNLAERALIPTLPGETDFPYTIRVESLVTESHGSSSMASVCGGCLALMDAGVPIKTPIAGIAMGMLLGNNDDNDTTDTKNSVSDEHAIILSDISGTEDAFGTMDFKVAGNREGITTFQLDIKCEGLTLETMERALQQAKEGRLHILDKMDDVLDKPRSILPSTVPKIASFTIPAESIGKIIGPGGKQIRAIIEDFQLENMDVQDDGTIQASSFSAEQLSNVQEFVSLLIGGGAGNNNNSGGGGNRQERQERPKYVGPDPEVGKIYQGKIKGIHPYGVFVEILPGAEDGSTPGLEGLCHVSELARERVRNCEGFMKSMNVEELQVKFLGMNQRGQLRLSRKAVLEEKNSNNNNTGNGRGRNNNDDNNDNSHLSKMSEEEVDVIVQAIESATTEI